MPYTVQSARPVARTGWDTQRRVSPLNAHLWLAFIACLVVLVWIAAGWISDANAIGGSGSGSSSGPSATPASWLRHASILAVYGRGLNSAPVLGRLGMARSFDDLQRRTLRARRAVGALSGRPAVHMAIHLIYGMATPCTSAADRCLLYLDDTGVDVLRDYIRPAARRGWLVILDDQLGRSTPTQEILRLEQKGYLRYDNVEVAFDPEFRTAPDQTIPGSPPGGVTADEINEAQREIERSVAGSGLRHRKLLLVHQWTPEMVANRGAVLTNLRAVQPAVIMDGIGPADEKVAAYNRLMADGTAARGVTPGIKLFLPNPYAAPGGADQPTLTWPQVFGRAPVTAINGARDTIRPVPRIIIVS